MGLPEINLHLIPGGGGTMRLSKKIGVNLANEMIMTGRTVLAEEMHRHGLINYLYPKDAFIEKVTEFAASFANKEPDRLQTIKQLTQLSVGGVAMAAQSMENAALNNFYRSKEGQEKIDDCLEEEPSRHRDHPQQGLGVRGSLDRFVELLVGRVLAELRHRLLDRRPLVGAGVDELIDAGTQQSHYQERRHPGGALGDRLERLRG